MPPHDIIDAVDAERPGARPAETYASTITSADVKLAYNHDEDRFEAFIIGDINANPEGIAPLSEGNDYFNIEGHGPVREDGAHLKDVVAEGYLHNARQEEGDDITVAAVMHPATYDGDGWQDQDWLVADKQASVGAVEDHEAVDAVYHVLPGSDLAVEDGDLTVDGEPVAGYANVHDQGDALLYDFTGDEVHADADTIYAMAKGSNAATAVWNSEDAVRPYTDKTGLMDVAAELSGDADAVHTADHRRVDTVAEALELQDGGPIVIKGALGTWGDTVVAIDADADYEQALNTIRDEEERVRTVGNRPDGFQIVDEDGRFVQTSVGDKEANANAFNRTTYGLAEEGIAGTITRNSDEYTVFEHRENGAGHPVDFVPLATFDPTTGAPEVYNVTVRSAGTTNLNANRGGKNFTIQPLDEALERGVYATGYDEIAYQLVDEDGDGALEELAGRPVDPTEIRAPLEEAGRVAWATRNIAAFKAEDAISE